MNVFLEASRFPRPDGLEEVLRHREEPYIHKMRAAITDWGRAVDAGDIRDERALRVLIKDRIDEAGQRVGRWRKRSVSLGALSKHAKWSAGTLAGAGEPTAAGLAAAVAFVANLGNRVASWREAQHEAVDKWLLHGGEV